MKLFIITQKVDTNDSVLGFFHAWLVQFAEKVDSLLVVCLEEGEHDLPQHVRVLSLGKEKGVGRLGILKNLIGILIQERNSYDTVLVHMNPIYLVLAGWYWLFSPTKKAYLWYTHKHVDLKLWTAEKFVTNVFTASKESFRLKSKKIIVMGHGINTELFAPGHVQKPEGNFELLSVGRISRSKNIDMLVESLRKIKDMGIPAVLTIVGAPITTDDHVYYDSLKELVTNLGLEKYITFVGAVTNVKSVDFYRRADVFVHTSDTGSLDKVGIEAMACGLPVVSSNDAVREIVATCDKRLVFKKGDVDDLVRAVVAVQSGEVDVEKCAQALRKEIQEKHNISNLIGRLITIMQQGNV